jgi:cysteine desulfuration protein SufE
MTTAIRDKEQEIVEEFQSLSNWRDRYRRIIELGRDLPELPEEFRVDKFKVKGCQSQVWLHPRLEDGNVYFDADSDAAIVRGLIAIILHVYSGHPPDAILAAEPEFIDDIGLSEHLSQTRSNGLSAMLKQLRMYAFAMKGMQQA